MRALVIKKLGDPTLPLSSAGPLKLSMQTAVPAMTPNGVRIKVTAAALNFADALQVKVHSQMCKQSTILLILARMSPRTISTTLSILARMHAFTHLLVVPFAIHTKNVTFLQ